MGPLAWSLFFLISVLTLNIRVKTLIRKVAWHLLKVWGELFKRCFLWVKAFFYDNQFFLVAIERGKYLIPSRTQKSSLSSPMVLYARVWESRSLPGFFTHPFKATWKGFFLLSRQRQNHFFIIFCFIARVYLYSKYG